MIAEFNEADGGLAKFYEWLENYDGLFGFGIRNCPIATWLRSLGYGIVCFHSFYADNFQSYLTGQRNSYPSWAQKYIERYDCGTEKVELFNAGGVSVEEARRFLVGLTN